MRPGFFAVKAPASSASDVTPRSRIIETRALSFWYANEISVRDRNPLGHVLEARPAAQADEVISAPKGKRHRCTQWDFSLQTGNF